MGFVFLLVTQGSCERSQGSWWARRLCVLSCVSCGGPTELGRGGGISRCPSLLSPRPPIAHTFSWEARMVLGFSGHPARSTQPRLWPGVTAEPGGAGGSLRGIAELPTAVLGKPFQAVQRGNSCVVWRSALAPSRCHGRLFLAHDLALPFVPLCVVLKTVGPGEGDAQWSCALE